MAKKKPESAEECPPFEQSLAELEQIVAQLEGGKLPLSDALAAYEQGVRRLTNCYQILEHAERRIDLVQSLDADGRARTVPLDDAAGADLAEKTSARSSRRTARPAAPADSQVDDASSLF